MKVHVCMYGLTSGAIQKGVPTWVFLLSMLSVSCPVTPKSANFTDPSFATNKLPAYIHKHNICLTILKALNKSILSTLLEKKVHPKMTRVKFIGTSYESTNLHAIRTLIFLARIIK